MKKVIFLISFFAFISVTGYSQNNPLTAGSNNKSVEKILLSNKTDITLIAEKKVDVEILKEVTGTSKGFKFVPLIPFLPKLLPGVVNIDAKELEAEQNALRDSGGEILLNKKVERTYTGILFILWWEKIEVTGVAAKIIR